jgi:hypothetical protein
MHMQLDLPLKIVLKLRLKTSVVELCDTKIMQRTAEKVKALYHIRSSNPHW